MDVLEAIEEIRAGLPANLRRASSNRRFGNQLFELAQKKDEHKVVVEVGTCVGIACCYLLAGMAKTKSGGHLITFEGSPQRIQMAHEHINSILDTYKIDNVTYEIVEGNFDDTIPAFLKEFSQQLFLVFIDGNHQKEPTWHYHTSFRELVEPGGMIVHDDISWSKDMEEVWARIVADEGKNKCMTLQRGWIPAKGMVLVGGDSHFADWNIRDKNIDAAWKRPLNICKYWFSRIARKLQAAPL